MATQFSALELNILRAKGLTDDHLHQMDEVGIRSVADFGTVGDAATFAELVGASTEAAEKVIAWARGIRPASGGSGSGPVVVESPEVVYCVHCKTRQPKDYQSGDLCIACGKQAEPTLACFWCGAAGPGHFCRRCGAEFVPTGELELALQLRRDGLAKEEIPGRLKAMSPAEKDALWGLVRRPVSR